MRYSFPTPALTSLFGFILAGLMLTGLLTTQSFALSVDNLSADNKDLYELILSAQRLDDSGFLDMEDLETEGIIGERRVVPAGLYPQINSATFNNGRPTIEFQLTDEFGFGVPGFVQGDTIAVSFTVSKLVPGSGGETDNWSTYIRVADEGVARAQGGTYANGSMTDNGDGTYSFTFDDQLANIADVAFESELTHRIGMEVRDAVFLGKDVPGSDAVFDVQPSTGNTTDIAERTIIEQQSCANCHGSEEFAFHGGPRQSVEYCVTCHQKDSIDIGSGNTIDFRVMIHKIHFGAELTNLPFQICGFGCERFGAPPDDFSDVHFPQDTRNCTTCHDPANPATPQADNVNNRPTAAVCTSCHDDLAFDENGLTNRNDNHPGLAQPNENCAACHSEDGLIPSVLESHVIPAQVAARRFQFNVLEVSNTAEGQSPVVTFSVTDPTNEDAPYDLVNDPEFTGSATSINMDIAWPNSDYTNVANDFGTEVSGNPPSRPIGIRLARSGSALPTAVFDNDDGTYRVDTGLLDSPLVIPATTPRLGSGTVVIEGHPSGDFNGDGEFSDQVPATSVAQAFAINDAQPQTRREVVDPAKCQNCHAQNDGLAFHGNNRNDNTQVCVVCHNPNQTDLAQRPADSDGTLNGVNPDTPDGLEDRPIDFKFMIHAIHGSDHRENSYVVYGFGSRPHDFSEVRFPRPSSDCLVCHREGTYELPLGDNVLATTLAANATVSSRSPLSFVPDFFAAADPTDDNNASPTAAVCSACHDEPLAMDHMSVRSPSFISFGNAFLVNPFPVTDPDTQERIDSEQPENCFFCHGPGGIVDIADAHGLE
jgi:OmcA/MtrC family decaheme c-type cytochrome